MRGSEAERNNNEYPDVEDRDTIIHIKNKSTRTRINVKITGTTSRTKINKKNNLDPSSV